MSFPFPIDLTQFLEVAIFDYISFIVPWLLLKTKQSYTFLDLSNLKQY